MNRFKSIHRYISMILCAIMVCAGLGGCDRGDILGTIPVITDPPTAPTPPPYVQTAYVWDMYGTYVDADGKYCHETDFSISWKTPETEDGDRLYMQFFFSNSFQFSNMDSGEEGHLLIISSAVNDLPYFYVASMCYNKWTNAPSSFSYVLSKEEGYMMLVWGDYSRYLVASRDPDTPYQDILEYFQEFAQGFVNFDN